MSLEEERVNLSMATMFISFDLVNCTLYKSRYKGEWASSVSNVLQHIIQTVVESKIEGYRFWKVLGDEVVYTKEIKEIEEVAQVLNDVYRMVVEMNEKIISAEIGDEHTAEILAVKATAWIADISPANLCADNIYLEYNIGEGDVRTEYLGTDIDSGFRIAKFTSANRLVISADLAALFLNEEALQNDFHHIHFVAYRVLKGIWNGRPYPIFMYHADEHISFDDSIHTIANANMDILEDYLQQAPQRYVEKPYRSYEEQLLASLYGGGELNKEVGQLIDIIAKDD